MIFEETKCYHYKYILHFLEKKYKSYFMNNQAD